MGQSSSRTVLCTTVKEIKKVEERAAESRYGPMAASMRVTGRTIQPTALADSFTPTVTTTKVTGSTTRLTAGACSSTPTAQNIWANGKMKSSTDLAKSIDLMALFMRATTLKA